MLFSVCARAVGVVPHALLSLRQRSWIVVLAVATLLAAGGCAREQHRQSDECPRSEAQALELLTDFLKFAQAGDEVKAQELLSEGLEISSLGLERLTSNLEGVDIENLRFFPHRARGVYSIPVTDENGTLVADIPVQPDKNGCLAIALGDLIEDSDRVPVEIETASTFYPTAEPD